MFRTKVWGKLKDFFFHDGGMKGLCGIQLRLRFLLLSYCLGYPNPPKLGQIHLLILRLSLLSRSWTHHNLIAAEPDKCILIIKSLSLPGSTRTDHPRGEHHSDLELTGHPRITSLLPGLMYPVCHICKNILLLWSSQEKSTLIWFMSK